MKKSLISFGLAAALVAPVTAEAFTIPGGVRVNPVNDQVFEVIPKSSGSFEEIWCGASEYARRVKGAAWQDLVYVVQGRSTSVTTGRKTAVQFSLSSEVAGKSLPSPQGWLALGFKPGNRMTVQSARSYCDHSRVRF
ncbi:MAG: hypothetical protein BM559_08755 [Roseobacter sp. MedPE-SWchi]|nr:MAG: hypothetical protein BM559_08755 [Roseobacter sp. MedPE-SWchi]